MLSLAAAASIGGTALGSVSREAGTLELSHAVLTGRIAQVDCPAGAPDSMACFQLTNKGRIRGLGAVLEQNLIFVEGADTSCEHWHASPVLTVPGKGEIELSLHPAGDCVVPTTGILAASLVFTVTGGTGIYAGASGSGALLVRGTPGSTNTATEILDGSLTVAGLDFDLAPPVLRGAVSKTVLAPRKAKRMRVTYAVKARDAVDGAVPVACKPRSGSSFKVGRTKIRCSATDSSGNTATATFTVTVKRRH